MRMRENSNSRVREVCLNSKSFLSFPELHVASLSLSLSLSLSFCWPLRFSLFFYRVLVSSFSRVCVVSNNEKVLLNSSELTLEQDSHI